MTRPLNILDHRMYLLAGCPQTVLAVAVVWVALAAAVAVEEVVILISVAVGEVVMLVML